MCCRRNRGVRRAPLVVVLGKMAYDKYQERKAYKAAIARGSSPDPNFRRTDMKELSFQADHEIMEKAGIMEDTAESRLITEAA